MFSDKGFSEQQPAFQPEELTDQGIIDDAASTVGREQTDFLYDITEPDDNTAGDQTDRVVFRHEEDDAIDHEQPRADDAGHGESDDGMDPDDGGGTAFAEDWDTAAARLQNEGQPPNKPPADRPPRDGGDDDDQWRIDQASAALSQGLTTSDAATERLQPLGEESHVLLSDLMDRDNESPVFWHLPPDLTEVDPQGLVVDMKGLRQGMDRAGLKGRLLIAVSPSDETEDTQLEPALIPVELMPTMEYFGGDYRGKQDMLYLGFPHESEIFPHEQLVESGLDGAACVLVDGRGLRELLDETELGLSDRLTPVQRATIAYARVSNHVVKTALLRARHYNSGPPTVGNALRNFRSETIPTNLLVANRRYGPPLIRVSRSWLVGGEPG